jgi:hypothetical protein
VRIAAVLAAVALVPSSGADAAPCWPAPIDAVVVDPFRAPSCPYCSGNRGIEFRVPPGPVRSIATGVVTFAGSVGGSGYVVVEIADGWRLTYGRVARIEVRRGTAVVAGMPLAASDGELYLGLRIDGRYVDPAPYLGELVGRRRLVSIDRRSRPAPAELRCDRPSTTRAAAAGRRSRLGAPTASDSVAAGPPPGSPVVRR